MNAPDSDGLLRRGLWLEYATLAWNVVGTPIIIWTAAIAGSTALAGFGFDSLIEVLASAVVVWQLKDVHSGRELRALRIIAGAFFLLSAYILAQSLWAFAVRYHPTPSLIGLGWLVLTVVAMSLLAAGKLSTGQRLGNVVLQTEARVTLVDAALAGAVLIGVGLDALLGWWWADPLAGLVIVYYGFKEGREAWRQAADATR